MRRLTIAAFAAVLTLVSGAAMAQTYWNGDPAFADTTDPGSTRWSYGPYGYAGGTYGYTYSGPYASYGYVTPADPYDDD
jgi:hypothetical protein